MDAVSQYKNDTLEYSQEANVEGTGCNSQGAWRTVPGCARTRMLHEFEVIVCSGLDVEF